MIIRKSLSLIILTLFFIFFQQGLEAEEVQTLTFSQLWALVGEDLPWKNRQIRIRGFLYSTLDEKLFLAEQPNLKSCCTNNLKKKIEISGSIKLENVSTHAHLIEGLLQVELFPDEQNALCPFRLENAQIVSQNRLDIFFLLSIGVVLILVFGIAVTYISRPGSQFS